MKDENYILIEDGIVDAVSFRGVVSGTTAVLVDMYNLFGKRALNKIIIKIKNGARETHEVCWRKNLVEVTKLSKM